MGQPVTLLFALLMIGAGPVAEDPAKASDADVSVEASVAGVQADVDVASDSGSADAPSTESGDGPARASATSEDGPVAVTAEPVDAEIQASPSSLDVKVAVGDDQIVSMDYTPPSTDDIAGELTTSSEETTDPAAEETEQASASQASPSSGGPSTSSIVAWSIAPVTGVAAAAAAGYVSPAGSWLRRLVGAVPLVPLYSRISADDALEHESRAAIYEALQDEPGLSLEQICERTDLARSTARHHVRKLEQTGLIDHAKLGRSRVHYPVGAEGRARRRHLLDNETRRSVMEAVEDEARNLSEIARQVDVNPGSVHFHIDKLVEADLVEPAGEGRYRAVEPDEATFEPAKA